jgi:hypothetical protein
MSSQSVIGQRHNSLEDTIWNALSYDNFHIPSSSDTVNMPRVMIPGKEAKAVK